MGRHSSPNQWPFYRSVAGWFLPWVLIAIVVGVAVWTAVAAVGEEGGLRTPPSAARAERTRSPSPHASATQSPTPVPTATPRPSPTKQAEPKPELITRGITVQVLNGTNDPAAAERMAARLRDAGFAIAAVNPASKLYPQTTVLWSVPATQKAAEALADHFGWEVAEKPANLTAAVSIHVVVGADEV